MVIPMSAASAAQEVDIGYIYIYVYIYIDQPVLLFILEYKKILTDLVCS